MYRIVSKTFPMSVQDCVLQKAMENFVHASFRRRFFFLSVGNKKIHLDMLGKELI